MLNEIRNDSQPSKGQHYKGEGGGLQVYYIVHWPCIRACYLQEIGKMLRLSQPFLQLHVSSKSRVGLEAKL